MKPRTSRTQLRLLVALGIMMAMLMGTLAPAAAGTISVPGTKLFQTAELCRALDADDNLNLEPDELAQLAVDLNSDSVVNNVDRDIVAAYCQANTSIGAGTGGQKVFVCKYVGTPGIDERLQTGNNPISVSVNAIPNYQGIGSYFADAQGRSYVLAEDNRTGGGQTGEPGVDQCPAPDGPDNTPTATPTVTPMVTPTVTPTTPPVNPPKQTPPAKVTPPKSVTGMPNTGSGSTDSDNLIIVAAGIAALAMAAYGVRKQSKA